MRHSLRIATIFSCLSAIACAQNESDGPETTPVSHDTQQASPEWRMIEPGGETACSDGSPFRYHVKPGKSEKLFVFLNGGGACWNSATCDIRNERPVYFPRTDMAHNDPTSHKGVFDLTNPENPLKDWTMVFVPYCTGDIHLGSKTRDYTADDGLAFSIHHNGAANVKSALDWISENTAPDQIVVAGASAGALASPFYAGRVAEMFPQADILQFAGGASGYGEDTITDLLVQWGVSDILPANAYSDVDFPAVGVYAFYDVERTQADNIRFSLYDTAHDNVQIMFRRLNGANTPLPDAIRSTYHTLDGQIAPVSYFLADGDFHTILRYDAFYEEQVGDVAFTDWFSQLLMRTNPAPVDCASTPAGCAMKP